MARIRVDTEDLKAKAEDFESAADAFNRAGDEIAAAAMAMPSYDGQLSGPARKARYEIQARAREMKANLAGDAESLRKTAQAFEDIDNQAIDVFSQSQEALLSASLFAGFSDDRSVGSAYLGYNDDPTSDTVILCMYCVCTKISRAGNEKLIADYEQQVKDYNAARTAMWAAYNAMLQCYAAATAAILASAGTGGLVLAGAIIAIGAIMAEYARQEKLYEEAIQAEIIASKNAATDWNLLSAGTCAGGDEKQGPHDSHPCADQKVYEP